MKNMLKITKKSSTFSKLHFVDKVKNIGKIKYIEKFNFYFLTFESFNRLNSDPSGMGVANN